MTCVAEGGSILAFIVAMC